jgi:hypothetical protein
MHTNNVLRVFYKAETHYAGGDGGAAYSHTHATATTGYTSFPFLAGIVNLGGKKWKRNRLKCPGLGLGKGQMLSNKPEYKDLVIEYYIQGADPFLLLLDDGTEGSKPASYTLNMVIPDATEAGTSKTFTAFGAELKSYECIGETSGDNPPTVKITFDVEDVIEDAGPTDFAAVAIPVTAVQEWEDFIITLDGDAILELKSFNFKIDNILTEAGSGYNGSFGKFQPIYKDRILELEVGLYKDAAAIMYDKYTQAINSFTSIFNNGLQTVTITNCYVDDDNGLDSDGKEVKEAEYKITVKNGDSTITAATT